MIILGIETSCDETGVAIYDSKNKKLIANQIYSQAKLHSYYGGVVPELASRNHIKTILPMIKAALLEAKKKLNSIDAIAYTAGPGLAGSLLVGATISHSLAYSLNIPAVPVNHMEGHLLSPMLENNKPDFPFVALLVSGGHTQLIQAHDFGKYKILGESVDDAAGEAFDKVAKLLGIKYPGGSMLEKIARKGKINKFNFPRPMIHQKNMNFSFSGLKTFTANIIRENNFDKKIFFDIALGFENAIIDVLIKKCYLALKFTGYNKLIIAGGVSANLSLRNKLKKMVKKNQANLFFSRIEFCTDNGAMIAYAGMMRLKSKTFKNQLNIQIYPKWSLMDISEIF